MQNTELSLLTIITSAGSGKSSAVEAITLARHEKYKEAALKIENAEEDLIKAGRSHLDLIKMDMNTPIEKSLLLIHAEDQLITSQLMIELAREFIDVYKKINKVQS